MTPRLLTLLYNLAFPLVFLAMLPGIILRMARRGNYRHKFGQRFALYSRRVRDKLAGAQWTWIHAVSVGEVMIALKLISALRRREPGLPIVLSTTTSTGYRLASRQRSATFEPIYTPLDFPLTVGQAFARIRPTRLILVEAELWPNTIATARHAGTPIFLVNARLSPKSERRFQAVRPLAAALYNQVSKLGIQNPDDLSRWLGLGVHPEKILITGSIKFDPSESPAGQPARDFRPVLERLGVSRGAPILLGGSTFEGEEEMLADVARQLRDALPGLFLILVPRHAERGPSVLRKLENAGHRATLSQGGQATPSPEVLIVNSTGELRDWYACAHVVFIGKSLAPNARGGQNPAEAISAGKPVLFGPNMQNFEPFASQLIAQKAALRVTSASALASALATLLRDEDLRHEMAARGQACLEVHRGATLRTVEMILQPQP